MKKLLIISLHADPSMPPGVGEWGGTHTYMRELLTKLYDTDYKVILITGKVYPNEETVEHISPFCRILRLTLGTYENFDKRDLYALHEVTFLQTLEKLNELKFVPDIIHSVYWNSGHLAMRLSNLWNVPYVHSVISNGKGRNEHGATGTAPHRIEIETQVFTHASLILCVAQSEKAEICKYYDIQPSNFQRFCIQVIFFLKKQVIPVFLQFQIHCTYESRMPLYVCIFHPMLPSYFRL